MDRDQIRGRLNEDDFPHFVQELLDLNRLEKGSAVEGIGKRISKEGIDQLSPRQIHTFIDYGLIRSDNYVDECARCAEDIPFSEMLRAVTEDDLCSYCRHISEKDD